MENLNYLVASTVSPSELSAAIHFSILQPAWLLD
jgi:hypothetical protein